jgi:hypothetical protein
MRLRTNQEPCAHKHSHSNYKHLWTFTGTSKEKAYTLREYIHKAPLPKNPNQKLEGSHTIFL